MRPVDRGPPPDGPDGTLQEFRSYQDARDLLVRRLGDYCSYCEVALHAQIHVEHVRPKSLHPALELAWGNFLLACDSCNSVKGGADPLPSECCWPDTDNTFRAFDYHTDQAPRVAGSLTDFQRQLALGALQLTGLDREPGHPRLSDRDRRWKKRREAWGVALIALGELQRDGSEGMRQQVLMTAVARGFWSVWMTVFQADVDMRRRLIRAFAGTAADCFSGTGEPTPRPGGRL